MILKIEIQQQKCYVEVLNYITNDCTDILT